jgi:acylphosphatase
LATPQASLQPPFDSPAPIARKLQTHAMKLTSKPYPLRRHIFKFVAILMVFITASKLLLSRRLPTKMSSKLLSVDFEVSGLVQGVFFRAQTQLKAGSLGVVGWCANTKSGTVIGTAQAHIDALTQMKHWLQTEGSPDSRIEKCVFTNEKDIDALEYTMFEVRRGRL